MKSNKEKQREFRARKAKNGLVEVRGIFVKKADAHKVKAYGKKINVEYVLTK